MLGVSPNPKGECFQDHPRCDGRKPPAQARAGATNDAKGECFRERLARPAPVQLSLFDDAMLD